MKSEQVITTEEQKKLVEKFIKENKNYKDNEDLYDDFCSEIMQKLYMYINSVDDEQRIENYIRKVANTSILTILKDYGRVKRAKNISVPSQNVSPLVFSNMTSDILKEQKSDERDETDVSDTIVEETEMCTPSFVWDFPDPKIVQEENLITKECLQKIAETVCVIHQEVPSMQFLNIFYLRYINGLKQKEIGDILELPKAEVSKRLMKLSKMIGNILKSSNRSSVEV